MVGLHDRNRLPVLVQDREGSRHRTRLHVQNVAHGVQLHFRNGSVSITIPSGKIVWPPMLWRHRRDRNAAVFLGRSGNQRTLYSAAGVSSGMAQTSETCVSFKRLASSVYPVRSGCRVSRFWARRVAHDRRGETNAAGRRIPRSKAAITIRRRRGDVLDWTDIHKFSQTSWLGLLNEPPIDCIKRGFRRAEDAL